MLRVRSRALEVVGLERMSVWRTGLAGQRVSRQNPEWRREFEHTLPDLHEDDIAGSGFAITGYTVHPALGGDAALARVRGRLRQRGLRLMLEPGERSYLGRSNARLGEDAYPCPPTPRGQPVPDRPGEAKARTALVPQNPNERLSAVPTRHSRATFGT